MTKQNFPLKFPVEDFGGERITELNLRRPKGGDVRRINEAKGSAIALSFKMMADLAEVDTKLIDELDPEDIAAINDWLEPILDPQGSRARSS